MTLQVILCEIHVELVVIAKAV